jgi:hypothetical protein
LLKVALNAITPDPSWLTSTFGLCVLFFFRSLEYRRYIKPFITIFKNALIINFQSRSPRSSWLTGVRNIFSKYGWLTVLKIQTI